MSRYSNLVFLVLFSVIALCVCERIVDTNVGTIRGQLNSDGYFDFLGIPYGRVDSSNVFGEASPYPTMTDIYEADSDEIVCPQIIDGVFRGDFDCLRMNVFTPSTATSTSNLPVMVFIHGGSYSHGFGSRDLYSPKFFMQHGVIFVTINYRVGPYGFLCVSDVDVAGNQGLKDQYLALRWIRNNIAAFGGNPNEVTILGHSAGAHSVDFHLLSPREKLFNKAVIQSGSSLASTVLIDADVDAPVKIAERLSLSYSGPYQAIRQLSTADPEAVLRASEELGLIYKPCVEREIEGVEPFISHSWIDAPASNVEGIPILIGFTEFELLNLLTEADQFSSNVFATELNKTFSFDEERMQTMETYVRRFYLGDAQVGAVSAQQIINYYSDSTYVHPAYRSIKKFLEGNAGNIYLYVFSYTGDRSWVSSQQNLDAVGAVHGDDIRYLFDVSGYPAVSAQDQVIIDRMTTMWTNFAKYSDPTPETNNLLPLRWIPLTQETYNYLNISSTLSLQRRPFNRRMGFLDLLFKYNVEYTKNFVNEFTDDGSNAVSTSASIVTLLTPLITLILLMDR